MTPADFDASFGLIWLAPALPLLAAALIGLRMLWGVAGDGAEPATARIAHGAALAGFVLLLALDALALWQGAPGHRVLAAWFASGALTVNVSFIADGLSLPVATLAALIGWITLRFSAQYLHREAGFHRFYFALSLFLGGMQLIVLAGNGLLAFCGWELAGLSSYLLIGYAGHRPLATARALFAFVCNRAGDAGFLLGLALAAWWFNSFEWPALAGGGNLAAIAARLLVFGFVVAALVKSAQLPFSPWLAGALEGPTPSSAIFYGALMIHAGVYLLLRLEPVLLQAPDVMTGLALAGAATAVYAWLCGLVQSDVKSALAFATLFHVALMFVACGLGWFTVALWHLCLHAAWRAWQFLIAPAWLHLDLPPPAAPPAWLRRRIWLYTGALHGFWLDRLAGVLLARPTTAIAQDVRYLDEAVIDPLIGQPDAPRSAGSGLIRADGLAGAALFFIAGHLQALETRLSMRGRGGIGERLLRRIGGYVRTLEALLEQPRYLMLAVMATFVVIL